MPQTITSLPLVLVCDENNDLYRVLTASGYGCDRVDTLAEAVNLPVQALAVLADTYPRAELQINQETLMLAAEKKLRIYVEYPAALPGYELAEPRPVKWERLVVSSQFFAPAVSELTILMQHGCWYLPTQATDPHLVVARVAGYRSAVFGLPEDASPILFQLPNQDVLVATTKLSQFVTGRYAPASDWRALWQQLLAWLVPGEEVQLVWEPTVGVQAGPNDCLPADAEQQALKRSLHWFRQHVLFSIGRKGAIEGYESSIDYNGRQYPRTWVRADCMAESAMVFAYDWAIHKNPDSKHIATQILDWVWSAPDFYQSDPQSPAYGLVNWYERGQVFYGDDNARVILPTLAAGKLLNADTWDEKVLRCLLANLRTTGKLGFREQRIDLVKIPPEGWRHYRDDEHVMIAPHFEAYLWACFIWAYGLTGYEGFLSNTINAIKMTVEAYPKWKWTNGLSQEIARMLLPLSFLVRVADTAEHRSWLQHITTELEALVQPCGAVRESLGLPEYGRYPSPPSNAAYGTNEASVLQKNGDPACDMLYTMGYAFLGLHEAAHATGNAEIAAVESKMADFYSRIQVRSDKHGYLDGAWMRSFDYNLWEYWGSSADAGWGAWCVETGWTNTWIASVLAMRATGESLFDLSTSERIRSRFPALLAEMIVD